MADLELRASDYENAPTERGAFYEWERELLAKRRAEAEAEIADRERDLWESDGAADAGRRAAAIAQGAVFEESDGAVAASMDYAKGYDAAMRHLAAGQGLDLDFVRERANVGRKRIEAAGGDVDLAIERAVRGD